MNDTRLSQSLEKTRRALATRVRALRKGRRLTQAELAARLGLSQGRLSELERGNGSFTAEQLLLMLGIFNVTASHFVPPIHGHDAEIQNALARLGAVHLREDSEVLPTERLEAVGTVVREVLLEGSPRHLTALAPILVRNVDRLNLAKLRVELAQAGLERRLSWLVDNTLEAIRHELRRSPPKPLARQYRRAETVLEVFMEPAPSPGAGPSLPTSIARQDLLDATIGSAKTRREVAEASSPIAKRWGIVTSLQSEDFVKALRAVHDD